MNNTDRKVQDFKQRMLNSAQEECKKLSQLTKTLEHVLSRGGFPLWLPDLTASVQMLSRMQAAFNTLDNVERELAQEKKG